MVRWLINILRNQGGDSEKYLLFFFQAYLENHPNQFTQKSKSTPLIEESLLDFVQSFNGIGDKKALELLKKYQSMFE